MLSEWNKAVVEVAAKELEAEDHKVVAVRCDASDDAQVEALVAETIAEFGSLDVAYNNPSVQNVLAETANSTPEDYDRVMGTNLRGVWNL